MTMTRLAKGRELPTLERVFTPSRMARPVGGVVSYHDEPCYKTNTEIEKVGMWELRERETLQKEAQEGRGGPQEARRGTSSSFEAQWEEQHWNKTLSRASNAISLAEAENSKL